MHDDPNNQTRRLAKVIRELVHRERWTSLADLTDALKYRCVRLRLPWTNDTITAAYRLVDSNLPLVECRRGVWHA